MQILKKSFKYSVRFKLLWNLSSDSKNVIYGPIMIFMVISPLRQKGPEACNPHFTAC